MNRRRKLTFAIAALVAMALLVYRAFVSPYGFTDGGPPLQ